MDHENMRIHYPVLAYHRQPDSQITYSTIQEAG